ncbi:V-type ATPase assembly factor Pkr1p [[Candida] railenensis]|uniref:V-type ATPase assembly factor Pkr1p n=1 Tax=[Candida] railenensis TaxID=45579 RepID=A0A9P0QSE5_9ASCO|nr:V-type ATPase assembly factor Pkr1p [[Candida] railenensis]
MASFVTELWDSVFQPGTNPALIKATHGSFVLLILSLLALIYMTRSIHFINLLVIACLLYGTVVWFIGELQQAKLNKNLELEKESQEKKSNEEKSEEEDDVKTSTGSEINSSSPTRKTKKV